MFQRSSMETETSSKDATTPAPESCIGKMKLQNVDMSVTLEALARTESLSLKGPAPRKSGPTKIETPNRVDVIAGRGKLPHRHEGNILFRRLIQHFKERYQLAPTRQEKRIVTNKIIAFIQENGGRFLKSQDSGGWYLMGEDQVHTKVSHALRSAKVRSRSNGRSLASKDDMEDSDGDSEDNINEMDIGTQMFRLSSEQDSGKRPSNNSVFSSLQALADTIPLDSMLAERAEPLPDNKGGDLKTVNDAADIDPTPIQSSGLFPDCGDGDLSILDDAVVRAILRM